MDDALALNLDKTVARNFVLILVVMDDALAPADLAAYIGITVKVLILVVMDDALALGGQF